MCSNIQACFLHMCTLTMHQIALTTPTLWRYVDFTCMSRKWCSEMLRRSGDCSLTVALRIACSSSLCPVPTSLDAARELLRTEYSGRLAALHLYISSRTKHHVDSLLDSLQHSAPRLEYIALHRTTWELVTISSFSRLPSLKRLRLNNVSLSPWVSPIFTALQELDISFDPHHQPRSHDSLISYDEMFTILCRMPELRRLALRNVFLEGTRADGMSSEHISLPNLRQLSLIDQHDLFSFAASLRLPSETCAEIKTNGQACVDTLLPQYELTFGPVRRLKLLVNRYPQVSLEFRASDVIIVDRSAPAQLRLTYLLLPSSPPPPLSPPSRIAYHFGAARLRMDGLLYLDIASHAPWPADCWRALFAHATQLRQVRAKYRGAVDGLILQVFLAGDSRWFPSLRFLKLSLVDLDEAVDGIDPPRTRGDLLLDGLAARLPGSEIWELEISDHEGCWIAKLRQIVPGVVHASM